MAVSSEEADQTAMRRLREGEDLALNEIMQRWKEPLTHYLFRQLGHRQDAIDLAQETFVRVYEQRLRYQPRGKFSTWLFTIATNLGRSRRRWQMRHPTVALQEEDGEIRQLLAAEADAASKLESRERALQLRAAIAGLPEDLRTALLLFEDEDFGYEEIAEILNCSPKAVETRLYRARGLLREKLAPLWERK